MTSPPIQLDLLELEKEEERLLKKPALEHTVLIEEKKQDRTKAKISDNMKYCMLTSLISRRSPALDVTEKDIRLAHIMQKSSPQSVENVLKRRIMPLQITGYEWDSTHSKRLRRNLNTNIRPYMDALSLYSDQSTMDLVRIRAVETLNFIEKADEFKDIYMYVEKKPKKRKEETAGISSAFMRFYKNNEKYSLGVFVKAVSDNRKMEGNAADYIAEEFMGQLMSRIGTDKSEISKAVHNFMKEYNIKVRESFNSTIGIGVALGDRNGIHIIGTKDLAFYKMEEGRLVNVFRPLAKNIGEDVQVIKGKGRLMYIDTNEMEKPDEIHVNENMLIVLNSSIPLADMELKRRFDSTDLQSIGKALVREIKSSRMYDDLGMLVFSK
jgi:hypothetical protein